MSCDIHLHIEVRLPGSKEDDWQHYAHPHVVRWYKLFAAMANVRNTADIEPVSTPRGLPAAMSLLTQFDHACWSGHAHTESWLTISELREAVRRASVRAAPNLEDDEFLHTFYGLDELESGSPFEEARVVFWFRHD